MDNTKLVNVGKTLLGIPFALIIWFLVYLAAHAALYLIDNTRGIADVWIQKIFREWFTPGLGGYVAIYVVNKYLSGANLKWVLIGFCLPILISFMGISLYIIIFHANQYDFSWSEQINNWGVAITTTLGAIIGYLICDDTES